MAITKTYVFKNKYTWPIEALNFNQKANQLSLLQFKCINQIFVLKLDLKLLMNYKCLFLSINASNKAFDINKLPWNIKKCCRDLEKISLRIYLRKTCNRNKISSQLFQTFLMTQ